VTDKRVLKLIRAFLKSGVMETALVSPVDEGTPQGGALAPPEQSRADDLDKELAEGVTVLPLSGRLQHLCRQPPRR